MLSASEVASFVADGYVAIRGAVPAGTVRACRDVIWSELAKHGVAEHDSATWTQPVVRIPCPEGGPFAEAGARPVLWEAFDQLIGPGRWWRRPGVGGTIPVRFPSEGDPGDAGWHIEASYESDGHRRVNIRSRPAACWRCTCSATWTPTARPRARRVVAASRPASQADGPARGGPARPVPDERSAQPGRRGHRRCCRALTACSWRHRDDELDAVKVRKRALSWRYCRGVDRR